MTMKTAKRRNSKVYAEPVFVGGGNVFEDLGRSDAPEALAKVELAYRIHQLIQDSGMTQTQAAKRLGVDQPKVSNLMRGRLKDFSLERLFQFLNRLGQDIEVRVRSTNRRQGRVRVEPRASM